MLRLIRERFVPVAVDQHIHRRLKDAEGELFAKVLRQAGRGLDGRSQGVYCFTPDGTLLTFANTAQAGRVRQLLTGALAKFDPAAAEAANIAAAAGSKPLPEPPAGGLILDVTAKVLGGYEDGAGRRAEVHRDSLGRDHLWVRQDEAAALASGEFPASLARRIAKFHLVDNTRGEPPLWRDAEIRRLEVKLEAGQVRGSVELQTPRGDRGYQADLYGIVESQDGQVTRIDLVFKGQFWGQGAYTPGAPPGKFPLAVALRLAADDCAANRVPPQAARLGAADYLR